jgi:hypothetical protein
MTIFIDLVKEGDTVAVRLEDWYKSYPKDNNQALAELINFLIQVSVKGREFT